jgi:Protein of unknown function (DUF3179)
VFRAEANGQPLVLDNAGVVAGNEVFKDRDTGSRWQQSSLEAISGPLKGTHLQLYPFLLTSWQEWRRLHPDTLVLKPLPGYADRIAEKNKMIREGLSGEGAAPKDVTYHDDRLKPKTMVLGVDVEGASKAFPLEALRQVRVVNDAIGGKPVLVVHQPSSDTTTAFVARAHGRALTFDAANAGATALVDRETGSRWNAYGACVTGRLKGSALESLVLEPEYWFAWSEFHRNTDIYAPPRP